MSHTNEYHTTTLPCGLRVVHQHAETGVAYCGYIILAGTRNEAPADTGMAHFIEHMSFKGTAHRRACHISNGLERVGGDLNAYTNKQETVYYATVLKEDFPRAADLLTDIVFHSTYPQREIDRETEVICDEIESYKDSPSEIIFDEFETMLFPGHPLGRDILGNAERLRAYTTTDALRFTQQYYRPDNAVFYVCADLDFSKIVRTLERLLPARPLQTPIPCPEPASGTERLHQTRRKEKGTHQAHVVIGSQTYGGRSPHRQALLLLNNILGGPGMNSRLNMALRERAGLVYTVDSSLTTYPDTGWWAVYFGCDAHDVERCRRITARELQRFIDARLTPTQLSAAAKQLCGQIGIARDNLENHALSVGKSFAWYDSLYRPEDLCERIRSVTAEEVRDIAAEIYASEHLTTLIYV